MNNSYIPNNEHFLKRARNIRNELLNRTDRYVLSDYPISPEQLMEIKEYRQNLREFINENEIKILAGEKVEFPQQPDFIELKISFYRLSALGIKAGDTIVCMKTLSSSISNKTKMNKLSKKKLLYCK